MTLKTLSKSKYSLIAIFCQISLLVVALYPWSNQVALANNKSDAINTGDMVVNLGNNLRVILVRQPSFPMVSTQLWYHMGKSGERKHEKGSCYAVKHTLDTQPFIEDNHSSLTLIKNAAKFDSFISDDFTTFIINARESDLDTCLKLQAKRFSTLTLHSKWMRKGIHASIKNHGQKGLGSYFSRLRSEVRSIAIPNYSNNHVLKASQEEHLTASASKVRAFYHQQFLNTPVTLVISGNIDSARTLNLVQKHFVKGRSTKKQNPSSSPVPPQSAEKSFTRFVKGDSNHVLISFRKDNLTGPDLASLMVLEALLNNKVNGILKNRFVEEDICTKASAMLELRRDTSLFNIYFKSPQGIAPELVRKDADMLFESLKDVSIDKVSLDKAKKRAIFKFMKERNGPEITAYQHGFYDSIGLHKELVSWTKNVNAVNDKSLNKVCKELLKKTNRTVGIFKAKDLSYIDEEYSSIKLSSKVKVEDQSNDQVNETDKPNSAKKKEVDTSGISNSKEPNRASLKLKVAASTVQTKILENGITLKLVSVPETKFISLSGKLKAGVAFEDKDSIGVSEVNTALMNGDSKNISKAKSEILQSNNGLDKEDILHFENGIENVLFHTNCLVDDLGTQLKLVSHHMRFPNMNASSIEGAIDSARHTLIKKNQNPELRLRNHLLRGLLSKDSVCRPTQINKELHLLKNISSDKILAFRKRTIDPKNLELAFVGDTTIEKLESTVNSIFSNWSKSNSVLGQPGAIENKKQILKVIAQSGKKERDTILIGRLYQGETSNLIPFLAITNCYLFQHPLSSKLRQLNKSSFLEEKLALIGSKTLWTVYLDAPRRDIEKTFRIFKREVLELSQNGLGKNKLKELQRYLEADSALTYGKNTITLSRLILSASEDNVMPLDIVRNFGVVTLEKVNRFIKEDWNPTKSLLVIDVSPQSKNLTRHLNLHK